MSWYNSRYVSESSKNILSSVIHHENELIFFFWENDKIHLLGLLNNHHREQEVSAESKWEEEFFLSLSLSYISSWESSWRWWDNISRWKRKSLAKPLNVFWWIRIHELYIIHWRKNRRKFAIIINFQITTRNVAMATRISNWL